MANYITVRKSKGCIWDTANLTKNILKEMERLVNRAKAPQILQLLPVSFGELVCITSLLIYTVN